MNKVRIISIDGGGVRGIIPAIILQRLEEKIQERTGDKSARLMDFVDLIVGSDSGGVIACAMLIPSDTDAAHPKYSAQEVADFFYMHSSAIFKKSLKYRIKNLWGAVDQKYSFESLKKSFARMFLDIKLSQAIKPCLVTAYEITSRKAMLFNQHNAKMTKAKDFYLRDLALATSAIPSYFQIAHISSMLGISYPLTSGALFANNPSMCAYTEARKLDFEKVKKPSSKDMFLLSLGTGSSEEPIPYIEAKNFRSAQWSQPIISIAMSGNSETVAHQLKWLFDKEKNSKSYIRISPDLMNASKLIDNASNKNKKALKEAALEYLSKNNKTIDQIVDNLVPVADTLS